MSEPLSEKDRFVKKLHGELVGQDALGNDLFVGDYILYAATVGQSAKLKAGKIIKVYKKEEGWRIKEERVKVQVQTIVTWGDEWRIGGKGTLSNCRFNAVLWKDVPQHIIDLVENGKEEDDA